MKDKGIELLINFFENVTDTNNAYEHVEKSNNNFEKWVYNKLKEAKFEEQYFVNPTKNDKSKDPSLFIGEKLNLNLNEIQEKIKALRTQVLNKNPLKVIKNPFLNDFKDPSIYIYINPLVNNNFQIF